MSESIISCKITSFDSEISLKFDLTKKKMYNWKPNTYVSFINGKKWYIGYINQIEDECLEAEISTLMELKKNVYYWPAVDLVISVPLDKILNTVTAELKNNFINIKLCRTLSNFEKYCASL